MAASESTREQPALHAARTMTADDSAAELSAPARLRVIRNQPAVLFLCVHNARRSQMAAGWLRHLAGRAVEVISGGSDRGPDQPHGGRGDGLPVKR